MSGFIPHTDEEIKQMLKVIGVNKIDDLFSDIPANLRAKNFNIPSGLTEIDVEKKITAIARKNKTDIIYFAGGGYYDHFIPAAVDAISSRSEFYTAYTPYQPEASQGTLQAIFEYQTMITRLTGLDYSNASLYDGGTALYEAIAMSIRTNNKEKVVIDKGVNPLFRKIVKTYSINLPIKIIEIDLKDIYTDKEKIKTLLDNETAAVVVQNPNFFGIVEDYEDLFSYAQGKNISAILVFYPVSLGILKTPKEMMADIAVAEGQSLGLPLSFGGPYLGVIAADKKYLRKMPGRIVGETVDKEGKKAYVLTLQAREQHIKREKATSNICSNQALCALRAAVFLSLLGKKGFEELAVLNLERTEYLKEKLSNIKNLKIKEGCTFNEFTIEIKNNAFDFVKETIKKGFFGGLPAGLFYEYKKNNVIISATEKRTTEEIDAFVNIVKEILEG